MPDVSEDTVSTAAWALEEIVNNDRWTNTERKQIKGALDELNSLQ